MFTAVPRVAPVGPRGGGGYVKSNFHLILQNACLDFNQTYNVAGIFLTGRGFRAVQMVLINDIPLGARQGAYVNSGERLAPSGSCLYLMDMLHLLVGGGGGRDCSSSCKDKY